MNAPDPAARDRVLDTAAALFYEHGFHAVGVDLIVARAAVAKTTLYRHFPSKDDLIVSYLERANEQFWAWFDASVDPAAPARDQLVAVFDAVETLGTSPACLGCA
ncbi:MAG: TetR/AcrR family transcriptional regulator, partial [Acidimicrobiales bacterium]